MGKVALTAIRHLSHDVARFGGMIGLGARLDLVVRGGRFCPDHCFKYLSMR